MANPRKFSEKIALHNQKQAEETAAFEKIMREVSDATSRPDGNDIQGTADVMTYQTRGRSMGVGPMRRSEKQRKDTSPYSSGGGTYLSPPDTSWRRTNSDSALHQTAMNIGVDSSLHSPGSQRRVTEEQLLGIVVSDPNDPTRKQFLPTHDGRPRSSCEVPRVPGINIYPSQQEPGTIQIPIGNNTGSLPDLTSFHFPSPLPTPLDHEDHSSSPYSTSPQATSPATLSPTSLSSRPMGRFSFGSPQSSQGPSPGHSPGSRRRHYPQAHLQNLVIDEPQSPTQLANHLSVPSLVNSRYLHTCKGVTVDSSNVQLDTFQQNQYIYQQQQQTQQQQQQQHHHQQHQQQQQQQQHQQSQPSQQQCNPNMISNSQNIPPQHLNSLSTYRTPQPLSRPSPQTSPSLTVQGTSIVYRSGSPGEASHSGPQSPVSPASSPGVGPSASPFLEHNNYCISQAQAAALQQHFEQFSMVDNPVTSINYIGSSNNTSHYSQAISHGSPEDGLTQVGGQDLGADPGYYSQSSPSQLQYSRPVAMNPSGGSTQQTTPQTPNTPSSIPDIILTDFSSSTGDDLSRQEFVKDLGSAMSGSFDSEQFLSDETLREGLGAVDLEGLQMLMDPDMNVITDPATEDNFRLDKL